MAQHWPSIQSFFQPDGTKARKADVSKSGDGFTTEEVDAVLRPVNRPWIPRQEYVEQNIGDLMPGPGRVTFTGRVANLFEMQTPSKRPRAANGFVKVILKDDTGALIVRLWFANDAYQLCLGDLCTIHATYIAHSDIISPTTSVASLMVSIFPERDNSCHFIIQDSMSGDTSVLCKIPLGYHEGQPLAGLMTLQNFIEGGYEVANPRVLVCVKSIGARKKFTNKAGKLSEKVDIGIFDDTAEASLILWGRIGASVSPWRASQTILLLTSPGIRLERRAQLSITSMTHVDVDPRIKDAEWLRKVAGRLTKRESVNPVVPEGGPLIDETGCLAPGKAIWTARAWRELFGGELDGRQIEDLKMLETRIVFGRVTLVFGWEGEEGGRVVVLGVRE
ncbi:hypothetical protein FGG08_000741 [Glutinoglossum americanum]|uniref:Uncharacterized protein n=1 Tax=Glutinoglossum americanum TaxID=1670608 RepID=A0A9P8L5V6_9PEZI|nr:hypothetical protein FGG08_000741 [Glutinoglossum americanum]